MNQFYYVLSLLTSEPVIVSGTKSLFTWVGKAIIGLGVAVTIAMSAATLVQRQISGEEEYPKYNKRLKSIIATGVGIVTISGLITFILAFYN